MIDSKKIISYIKKHINPYGKPFEGTVFEFGNKVMDYIKAMEKQPQADKCSDCSRRKFYQKGYQDGLNADKWISVEERLPSDEEYRKIIDGELYYKKVLATTSEGRKYVGIYDTEDECWYDDNGFMFFPIAWQPIQPYKK